MPELPQKKVGIVSCSGEELAEGTVSRLAALKVLEQLRPADTVTICLPLFLAGGEGDRAFAKFYPTIAIDGCEKRCAFRGTEAYSNRPAVGIVVSELVAEKGLQAPKGKRSLDPAGHQAVDAVAEEIAEQVDNLLGRGWDRRGGAFLHTEPASETAEETVATCSCGSGIPVQKIQIDGQERTIVALPLIFQNFVEAKKSPSEAVLAELMEMVKIYNPFEESEEELIQSAIGRDYQAYWSKKGMGRHE